VFVLQSIETVASGRYVFRLAVVAVKRKHFFSVKEYAEERHLTPGQVRRLCERGEVSAYREGRKWVILADQTDKARAEVYYPAPGITVLIPPIPPDGHIWDMAKARVIPIDRYFKEHGGRTVTVNGKRLWQPPVNPH
jgi:hypothetical protein